MIMHVYGDERLPKIVALHPMLSTGRNMAYLTESIRERYCVIAPDLSGQGEDTGCFESAQKEARLLYEALREKGCLELELVFGASLGAAVGLELLAMPGIKVKTAVFDGCPLFKNAPALRWLLTRVFLQKHRKAVSHPGLAEKRMARMYGPEVGPDMGRNFERIGEESLRAIVAVCTQCAFPKYPAELERRLYFEYGSRDFDYRMGRKSIARYYPGATLTVREGYGHCQYMSSMGERYGEVLEAYMARP